MTTKDFRVVCAIIASTVDYFGLPEEEENLILDDAKESLLTLTLSLSQNFLISYMRVKRMI